MKIRELGKAIGDFELNNIPRLIKALITLILSGLYLVIKLIVGKFWYVSFGILLLISTDVIETKSELYSFYKYYNIAGDFYVREELIVRLIIVWLGFIAIFLLLRLLVKKVAPFFE